MDFSTRQKMTSEFHSREAAKPQRDEEEIAAIVVDCAFNLHAETGPGLLESVYEVVLARMLETRGLTVKRQEPIPICLMGLKFEEGFRADLLVENALLVELKCVETLLPVHTRQVVTYLRLMSLPLGLLINFNATAFRQGVKRVVNNHKELAPSRLRGFAQNETGPGQQSKARIIQPDNP